MPVTPSHAGTRTTLDDLMNTLKLLEEEEQLPPAPESRISAWLEQGKQLYHRICCKLLMGGRTDRW